MRASCRADAFIAELKDKFNKIRLGDLVAEPRGLLPRASQQPASPLATSPFGRALFELRAVLRHPSIDTERCDPREHRPGGNGRLIVNMEEGRRGLSGRQLHPHTVLLSISVARTWVRRTDVTGGTAAKDLDR